VGNKIHVPNHQPDVFGECTNKLDFVGIILVAPVTWPYSFVSWQQNVATRRIEFIYCLLLKHCEHAVILPCVFSMTLFTSSGITGFLYIKYVRK